MRKIEKSFFSRLFSPVDIGIDLGTSWIRVFLKNRGIVLREPSIVAVNRETGRVGAIGARARGLAGREQWQIVQPLRHGVIAEFDEATGLLETVLNRVAGRMLLFKPRVMLCVPTGATGVERRAVIEAALQAGASKTYLAQEPAAAALGAGLPIGEPKGRMVVNIGSGTSSAAVLSMGQMIVSASLRQGGDSFNEALIRYLKRDMNLEIRFDQAEELKKTLGTVNPLGQRGSQVVQGYDAITGLSTSLRLTGQDMARGFQEPADVLLACVHRVLEQTPPELCADILETGIVLTGGGALLHGLAEYLEKRLRLRVYLSPKAEDCVAVGAGMALEDSDLLEQITGKNQ